MTSGTKHTPRYHPDYPKWVSLQTSNKVLPGNGGGRAPLLTKRRSRSQLGNQIILSVCPGSHQPPVLWSKSPKGQVFRHSFSCGLVTFKHKASFLSTEKAKNLSVILHKIPHFRHRIFYCVPQAKMFDFSRRTW